MPQGCRPKRGSAHVRRPPSNLLRGVFVFSPRGEPQVQVLGWLVVHGTEWAASWQAVRFVRVVLNYRVRCKEIELLREQSGLVPGRQSTQPACARHARRRRPQR
jgi:hypothetical protein